MSRKAGLILAVLLLLLIGAALWFTLGRRSEPSPAPVANQVETPATAAPGPETEPEANEAAAAEPEPLPDIVGRTETVSCRQGECYWHRIVGFDRVRTLPQGELRRIVTRGGRSRDDAQPRDVEWEPGEQTGYVFCSTERPAYAFAPDADGALIVHYLDLFDLAGYQLASARVYMRACHGRDYEEAMDLRSLGYRRGTRNEQVENGSPDHLTRF